MIADSERRGRDAHVGTGSLVLATPTHSCERALNLPVTKYSVLKALSVGVRIMYLTQLCGGRSCVRSGCAPVVTAIHGRAGRRPLRSLGSARTRVRLTLGVACAASITTSSRRTSMTFRLTALTALIMAFAAPTTLVHAQEHGHGDAVECASHDMGRARCEFPWSDARLVRQLSETRCVRGENWGVDHHGLWVDRGCAGRFVAAGERVASDERRDDRGDDRGDRDHGGWHPEPGWDSHFNVVCESHNMQYRFCAVDLGGAGRVSVARRISDRTCVEGRNWGSNRGGIWVNDGCAAEFEVDRRWR